MYVFVGIYDVILNRTSFLFDMVYQTIENIYLYISVWIVLECR